MKQSHRAFPKSLFLIVLFSFSSAFADTFKVGVALPITGWAAAYGAAFQKGLQLFSEEHSSEYKALSFSIEDSQYDGNKTVTAIQKLARIDNADLIFVWGDSPSHVAAPIGDQIKKPILTISFDSVATGRPYVASLTIPLAKFKDILAEFLKQRNWSRMGVLVSNVGATTAFVDVLRPALPPFIFEEAVSTDLTDFNSIISRLRTKPVDVLFVSLSTQQYPSFQKAANAQKFKTFLIGGDQLSDQTLRDSLRTASTGIGYLVGKIDPGFIDRYRVRFGDTSHVYEAATGYTLGIIANELAKRPHSDPKEFLASLPSTKFPQTPVGPISFSSSAALGLNAELTPGIQVEEVP